MQLIKSSNSNPLCLTFINGVTTLSNAVILKDKHYNIIKKVSQSQILQAVNLVCNVYPFNCKRQNVKKKKEPRKGHCIFFKECIFIMVQEICQQKKFRLILVVNVKGLSKVPCRFSSGLHCILLHLWKVSSLVFHFTEEAAPPLPSCSITHFENGGAPEILVSPPSQEKSKRNGAKLEESRPTVKSLLDELEGSVPSPRCSSFL